MTDAFKKFKKDYFEDVPPDGPNLTVLNLLDKNEAKEATRLLIEALDLQNIYAIRALSYMKAQEATPKLKKLFEKSDGYSQVFLAEALWNIEKYQPALQSLCKIASTRSLFRRVKGKEQAIIFLGEIKEKIVFLTLKELIYDKDPIVKYHAQRSLAKVLDLSEELEILEQSVSLTYDKRQGIAKEFEEFLERKVKSKENEL